MLEYVVNNRSGLKAAIQAAAMPTYEEARQNPVVIVFKSTTYRFKEGISSIRAGQLVRNIDRTRVVSRNG